MFKGMSKSRILSAISDVNTVGFGMVRTTFISSIYSLSSPHSTSMMVFGIFYIYATSAFFLGVS